MNNLLAFVPLDRRSALAAGAELPIQQVGTVLMADLSGFSKVTDRLMMEFGPKQAVDRLTIIINRCFALLVHQVHENNGAVISFGGDGITAVFVHDKGHHALICALSMQQIMKQQFSHVVIESDLPVPLRLKVAVAHGPFLRMCVGHPKIQLLEVVAGPAMDEVAAIQQLLQADQTIVDDATAHAWGQTLPIQSWITDPTTGNQYVLLADFEVATNQEIPEIKHPLQSTSVISESTLRQWVFPAIYERLQQEQGLFLADIRPVTILFLYFAGFDYVDDKQIQEKLDAYIQWIQQVVTRHQGCLLKLTIDEKGTYGVASFGAPKSSYADTNRALTAAIELSKVPQEFSDITDIKMGLNRGRVLAGAFGNAERAAYDLLGSAINLGSRYMMKAEFGQILLSEDVAVDAGEMFLIRFCGRAHLKGVAESVAIYELLGHHPVEQMLTDTIVAREQELAQLHDWLHQCRHGQGQIVIVEGVPGIGKSHLVARFVHQAAAEGMTAVIGACDYVGQQIPYYPWRKIMQQLVVTLFRPEPLTAQQQLLLTEFLTPSQPTESSSQSVPTLAEPQRRQEALFALLSEILVTCAEEQPLLLVIEDLYLADQASIELLRVVSRLVPNHALMIIGTRHPTAPEVEQPLIELRHQAFYHTMTITELPLEAIARIVSHCLHGMPDPLLLSLIHSQSQGNPLHAEEFALALQEFEYLNYEPETAHYSTSAQFLTKLQQANCLTRDAQTGMWQLLTNAPLSAAEIGLSDKLYELVNVRTDKLDEAVHVTLCTAAVLGQTFSVALLSAAHVMNLHLDLLHKQMAELERQAFLIKEQGQAGELLYRFRHNVVQQAVYAKLTSIQLQNLHRQAGEALEQLHPDDTEKLAFHFARSRQKEKALTYLEQAAQTSRQAFANHSALNLYEQALTFETRLEWQVAKVELLHILGEREQERAMLDLLAEHATQLPFLYPYLCGQYDEVTGQYDTANRYAEQALQVATQQEDAFRAALSMLLLGLIARRQGAYAQAIAWHERGLALVESRSLETAHEAAIVVDLYVGLSNVLRQQGKYEQARGYCQRALRLCYQWENRRGHANLLNTLGGIAYYLRDFNEARRSHQTALQIRRLIGELQGEGVSLYGIAALDYEEGNYDQAERLLQQAAAIQQAASDPWEEANILNLLGIIHYQLGDFSTAYAELQRGLQLNKQVDDAVGYGYTLCNLGLVLRDDGQLPKAARHLLDSIDIAKSQQERHLQAMGLSHLAIVYLREDNSDSAIHLATQALEIRGEIGASELTTIDFATTALAFVQRNQPLQAQKAIERALQILMECRGIGPEFPHWDYYHCHEVFWWLGDQDRAIETLQIAYEILTRRAQALRNQETQNRFLSHISLNQKILAAAERHCLLARP